MLAEPMNETRLPWTMAVAMLAAMAVAMVPLPPALFDLLLGASFVLAALTFLIAFYAERALELSAFPTLLLFVTLSRLALGVAAARLILTSDGQHGTGRVITAFGDFAIRGNFVVGLTLFALLLVINFVVITKGAERISEVAARFALDSLPGKQLAIDSDLGAGLIDEATARARRQELQRASNFYGAMDGASKFVRGDVIASLLMIVIELFGGMLVGVGQHGLSPAEAAERYTRLTVGEGLAMQLPALLTSTGAALLLTRGDDAHLSGSLSSQLLGRARPLGVAAVLVAALGLLPQMPRLPFLLLAAALAYAAYRATPPPARRKPAQSSQTSTAPTAAPAKPASELARSEVEAVLPLDLLGLELGLDLLGLVDANRGDLLPRIATLRKQLALDLGLIIPPIQIRDDLQQRPGAYRITLCGVSLAAAEVHAHRVLAIDPSGRALSELPGAYIKEPTFGLPAKWLLPGDRRRAEAVGCTVVDPAAVIATHLGEMIRRHAAELLGRREAQELLDLAARQHRTVIEELMPRHLSMAELIKVLRNLLAEGVSIRDMRTILEALADHAPSERSPDALTELVRQRLHRRLSRDRLSSDGTLRPLVIDPRLEGLLRDSKTASAAALQLGEELARHTRDLTQRDEPALAVVAPELRRVVAKVAARHAPGLAVLSYREVDPELPFAARAVVGTPELR